ncbi:unnamed protein product [Arabis nemorensis]|uniref:Aminotransferase-like plant mobile domain-containing protein n=1 Tax=Arabis nemorensis TaxID=586526 RepID=A0A565BGY4_9BRAS|nr:unnamed protein product [Arabis nemorensis]
MDSNDDELEHVAFLVCWLSYFVFPLRYYHLYEAVFPIAVHLSIGTKIALAPAVLAHLYAELSLLKNHIQGFGESTVKTDFTALFKLVQVWTWERFKELQPEPKELLKGEPRLALWHETQRNLDDVRRILDHSKIDSFEWRPFTKPVKGWDFPRFNPEKAMLVPVGPNLDDEFISFARCIKVSVLVGIGYVEHYFPDRVASQFGMLQNVPSLVTRNKLSQEEAWDHYNKPIDALALHIPSRYAVPCVTPVFCEWWRKTFQEFQSSKSGVARNIIGDDDTSYVPSGSKKNRPSEDVRKTSSKDSRRKRRKYMKLARESTSFVPSGSKMNRTSEDIRKKISKDSRNKRRKRMMKVRNKKRKQRLHQTMMKMMIASPFERKRKKKYSDVKNSKGDDSEPLGKKSRLETNNNDSGTSQKLASISDETEQRNEETDETGSKAGKKNIGLSPIDETNSSDSCLGANGVDIVVSPPETVQNCDDEFDVYGSNADMINDGSEEPNVLLQEDGSIAGEKASSDEKLCSEAEKEDDDILIQKKLETDELPNNNEPTTPQKLASGGTNGDETSEAYDVVTQGQDEEDGSIAGEKVRSDEKEDDVVDNERLVQEKVAIEEEKEDLALNADNNGPILREDDVADDNERLVQENAAIEEEEDLALNADNIGPTLREDDDDSFEKSSHEMEVLVSSIEARIEKAERKLAWLLERRAIRQRKIAAARLIKRRGMGAV